MLRRMNRTRLAALVVLGAIAVAAACTSKANNGEECLKNVDCVSDRCIQYVCVDPSSSRAPISDSGVAAETAADTAPKPDTAPADTGATPTDTGAETSASDTSAD